MKLEDINRQPFAMNRGGEIRVLGQAGNQPTFVWFWNGHRNITPIKGGRFESTGPTSGQFLDDGGEVIGYVSALADTPEIMDINAAMGEWHELHDRLGQAFHDDWLAEQLQMAKNSLRAGT